MAEVAHVLAGVAVGRVPIGCRDLQAVRRIERDEVVERERVGILHALVAHEADPVLAVRACHVDDRGPSGRDLVVGLAQQSLYAPWSLAWPVRIASP